MSESTLSVVIITKNEEDKITRCLESVKWAHEIVVIDGFSTDSTLDICREYEAKIVQRQFQGFDKERNAGIEHSSGDWILQLDADDVVTEGMRRAVEKVIADIGNKYVAYKFHRQNFFLGRPMRHGGWYHYSAHFFRKGKAYYKGSIHETLIVDGEMGKLEEIVEHYPFDSVSEFIDRQNRYTNLQAERMLTEFGIKDEAFIRKNLFKRTRKIFWKLYIKKKGFLEGIHGFIFGVLYAWIEFCKWAKYWELTRKNKQKATVLNNVRYERVSCCDLCGNSETRLIDEKGHIVQCKRCGLRFVSPRPAQEDVSKIYDWNYKNCDGWGKIRPEAEFRHKTRFGFLNRFVQKGKILDVGAGLGEFLSQAKKTNRWQCFGTETSRYALEYAKKELDIGLSFGQFEDLGYSKDFFDAVCFWHVLEHLPYPSRAIKETARVLKDNGFLFIAVPNDSWLGRRHFFKNALKKAINRLPMRKKLKLKKMYPEIDEEGNKHLSYFTPRTLVKLLERHGFEIKKYSVDYDYERFEPGLERKYRFDLLLCHLAGVNLSNAILVVAQKRKTRFTERR